MSHFTHTILGEDRLGAVFFLPKQPTDPSVAELLERIGATNVSLKAQHGFFGCTWAGLYCEAKLYALGEHFVLGVYYRYRDFFDMVQKNQKKDNTAVPLEEDGAYSVFLAFRAACERLNPEAAWVIERDWQIPEQFMSEREWMILGNQAEQLAWEDFSLLFLKADLAKHLPPPEKLVYKSINGGARLVSRDLFPCANGVLLFRRSGSDRW